MDAIVEQINAVLEDVVSVGREIGRLHAEAEVIGGKPTTSDADFKRLIAMQAALVLKRRRVDELFGTLERLAVEAGINIATSCGAKKGVGGIRETGKTGVIGGDDASG